MSYFNPMISILRQVQKQDLLELPGFNESSKNNLFLRVIKLGEENRVRLIFYLKQKILFLMIGIDDKW